MGNETVEKGTAEKSDNVLAVGTSDGLGLEIATEEDRKIGWTYSYPMLDKIQQECRDAGWDVGFEGAQEVLFALERRGIITRPKP